MVPAHEGLDADHPSGGHLDLGLVVQHETLIVDHAAQLADEGQLARAVLVEGLAVGGHPRGGVLGGVHGDVGPAQEGRGVAAVARSDRHADSGTHLELEILVRERSVQVFAQAPGQGDRPLQAVLRRIQEGELVTAEPGDGDPLGDPPA